MYILWSLDAHQKRLKTAKYQAKTVRLDKMSRREYQTERRRISVWTKCPNVDNRMERDYVEKNTKILLVS